MHVLKLNSYNFYRIYSICLVFECIWKLREGILIAIHLRFPMVLIWTSEWKKQIPIIEHQGLLLLGFPRYQLTLFDGGWSIVQQVLTVILTGKKWSMVAGSWWHFYLWIICFEEGVFLRSLGDTHGDTINSSQLAGLHIFLTENAFCLSLGKCCLFSYFWRSGEWWRSLRVYCHYLQPMSTVKRTYDQ